MRDAGSTGNAYELHKIGYLDTGAQCDAQGIQFIPTVAEPTGGWGQSGHKTLHRLAKAAVAQANKTVDEVLPQYFEGLLVTIRKAHAQAALRRCQDVNVDVWPTAASEIVATLDLDSGPVAHS